MARRQHAVELSVGDIDQRLRSEKSHQQLGRRGFDSRHLQEGVFAVRGMLCSQLIRRRALLEVSHAPPSADADERPVNHPSIVGPPKRGRPPERGTPTVHRARAPTSAAIAAEREKAAPARGFATAMRRTSPGRPRRRSDSAGLRIERPVLGAASALASEPGGSRDHPREASRVGASTNGLATARWPSGGPLADLARDQRLEYWRLRIELHPEIGSPFWLARNAQQFHADRVGERSMNGGPSRYAI
jgi:hypothetical protein